MNTNGLIRLITRLLMRKGAHKGIDLMTGAGKPGASPVDRKAARQMKQAMRAASRVQRMTRRF